MSHRLKHGAQIIRLLDAPRCGAELGVERGYFTEQLLSAFPRLVMFAVDKWDQSGLYESWPMGEIEAEFRDRTKRFGDRVKQLKMDTVEAASVAPDGLDFVFIDAEHTFDAVKREVAAWMPKIKPGGLLAGHDYCPRYQGVIDAVDELFPNANTHEKSAVWWIWC